MGKTISSIQPYIINKEADFKSSIIISIIIGIFIYFYVFGYKIINPYYTDWIFYQWLDVAQHYTGWLAFLHSPWQFPLLLTDKLTYPENISIFWTDSNPLFSIIFKILAPVYNYANIQFIGLYSFISLILSSVFASQIVRYFNKNLFIIILGTIFLVYKPTVLHRLVVHANLSSQFFIYACIAYILSFVLLFITAYFSIRNLFPVLSANETVHSILQLYSCKSHCGLHFLTNIRKRLARCSTCFPHNNVIKSTAAA